MRRLATMCAVLALGCDATRVFEVPAEVTYAALIEPGSRSPLLPIAEATTALASELSAVTLLGFSGAQLGPPALSIDQTEPLSLDQRPCGLLPRASGAWRWGDGGPEPVEVPSLALGARWISAGCPAPALLSASCRSSLRTCSGQPTVLGPCAWSIPCDDGGTVELNPGVWTSALGCAAASGTAASLLRERWSEDRAAYQATAQIGADTCVFQGQSTFPPPVEPAAADLVRLWEGTPTIPSTLLTPTSPSLDNRAIHGGHITGFLIDRPRRRAIAAVSDGLLCPTATVGEGVWRSIDLDTLAVSTSTLTTPGCLIGVRQVSPEGAPFRMIGFNIDDQRRLFVSEYDAAFHRIRRALLGRLVPALQIGDVLIRPDRWLLVTTVSGGEANARVLEIDPATLEVTRRLNGPLLAVHSLEVGASGEVLAYLRNSPSACVLDAAFSEASCSSVCGPEISLSPVVKFTSLARDPSDGALVLTAADRFAGVYACGPGTWLRPPGDAVQVVASAALSPGRLLVSTVERMAGTDGAWSGRLMIADLAQGGFEPQTWSLPGTVATALVRDGEAYWAVLPFDGLAVRWRLPP